MDKIESDNKFIKIAEKKISNLKKTKIDKIIIHKKSVAPSALSEFKLYEIMPVSLKFNCPAKWSAMEDCGSSRFCQQCEKQVHEISALSEEEAQGVISTPDTCVRFEVNAQGQILTRSGFSTALIFGSAIAMGCGESTTASTTSSPPTTTSPPTLSASSHTRADPTPRRRSSCGSSSTPRPSPRARRSLERARARPSS